MRVWQERPAAEEESVMQEAQCPTQAEADAFCNAVATQWAADGRWWPSVRFDWDWTGEPVTAIVWEEGPFQWTYLFPYGGRTEMGGEVPDVSGLLPAGWWAEPVTGWAIAIYPA